MIKSVFLVDNRYSCCPEDDIASGIGESGELCSNVYDSIRAHNELVKVALLMHCVKALC